MIDPDAETNVWPEGETGQNETVLAHAWAQEQSKDSDSEDWTSEAMRHGKAMWAVLVAILIALVTVVFWGILILLPKGSSTSATPQAQPGITYTPPPVVASPPSTITAPPSTVTEPPYTVTVVPPSIPPARDSKFLSLIANQGIGATNGDPQTLIDEAHTICGRLGQGESENSIVRDVRLGSSPALSYGQVKFLTDTAITLYCPVQ